MKYTMNEGSFEIPTGWQDDSENVLLRPEPRGEPKYQLRITREPVYGAARSADELADQHLREVASMPDYRLVERTKHQLGEHEAVQVSYEFDGDGPLRADQLFLLRNGRVLRFMALGQQATGAAQAETFQHLIATLEINDG